VGTLIRSSGYCSGGLWGFSSAPISTYTTAVTCGVYAASQHSAVYSWGVISFSGYYCYYYPSNCSVQAVATCPWTSYTSFNMYAV
jgi:hypothetical protein